MSDFAANLKQILAPLFGRLPDGSYDVPAESPDKPSMEMVMEISDLTGLSTEEVLDMDMIDLIEGTIVQAVRIQATEARIWARENGAHLFERTIAESMCRELGGA